MNRSTDSIPDSGFPPAQTGNVGGYVPDALVIKILVKWGTMTPAEKDRALERIRLLFRKPGTELITGTAA